MHGSWALVPVMILALCGCRSDELGEAKPGDEEQMSLEDTAREAGLVAEDETQDPVGAYALQHENGLHQLCIGPAQINGRDFGIVADLGDGLICQGRGSASLERGALTLSFEGLSKCKIKARYDGLSVRMPGVVSSDCASLCSARATFAGMIVRRTGWDADEAEKVKARIDRADVKSGHSLCS